MAKQTLDIIHCFRSPVGGIFRHVRDLLDAQVAAGHRVGIICDSSTGGAYEDAMFKEIEPKLALGLQRVKMQRSVGFGDLVAARRTYKAFENKPCDIIHGHGAKGGLYARLFGAMMRRGGRKVASMYSPHGGSLHYSKSSLKGRVFFLAERAMERITDCVLYVSDYELKTYEEKIGAMKAPYRIIHNGLQPHEFEPVQLVDRARDFLYIGMMRDLKGPDIFVDGLAKSAEKLGRTLTAHMVGDGDQKDEYVAQVKAKGTLIDVKFHPAMPARDAFALSRLVVVPSRAEALPYIVLEALSGGKSMIVTDVGGISEVVGKESNSLIAPDADELSAKMLEALSDETAYAKCMPSQDELKAGFGADVMARNIEAAYLDALNAR